MLRTHFLCPGEKIFVRDKCCARGQTGKHLCRQQCVRNNVSSFARAFRHRNAPRNIRDLFQDISNIHPYNTRSSASHNFYTQNSRLSIQLNSFSRIGTKIWNEMPLTLRNLSKHDFKRKIKTVLFNILSSEDSYLDIRNVIQKVKFS